jgi:hypothetical protein
MAIVIDYKFPQAILGPEANQRRLCSAMLSDVHQAFLDYADQFPARICRHIHFLQLGNEVDGDSGVSAETFYELRDKVKELMRSYIHGPHTLHQFAEV